MVYSIFAISIVLLVALSTWGLASFLGHRGDTGRDEAEHLRVEAGQKRHTYGVRGYLLSDGERCFHRALVEAVKGRFIVAVKVRLADIIDVRREPGKQTNRGAFWKISSKHIDFVLVDPDTTRIVCCIELDDSSHDAPDRVERDAFVDAAVRGAGLRLVRVRAAKDYSVEILNDIFGCLRAA